MTKYYTQEQIDEIGVFMANKISENSEALKTFVQQKINEMEPVSSEPDSSGGSGGSSETTEIKVKKALSPMNNNSETREVLFEGIALEDVLSVSAYYSFFNRKVFSGYVGIDKNRFTARTLEDNYDGSISVLLEEIGDNAKSQDITVIVTYANKEIL